MCSAISKSSLNRTPVQHPVLCLLVGSCLLMAGAPVSAADWLKPLKIFGDEEEIVVWQGPGVYVKIVEQDRYKRYERPPKNEHPAVIGARDIAAVLASLKVGNSNGPALFNPGEIAQVAPKLAEALGKVQPRQDVIFAVSDVQGKSGRRVTAARAFVAADQLNIILGDTLQPGGENAPQIINQREAPWRPGRRRETLDSAQSMAGGPGISFRPGARSPREDWAVIDVRTLAAAYRGPQIPLATVPAPEVAPADEATGETNAQLLQERQQMRLEMARMRKQLEAQPGAETTPAAAPVPQPAAPAAAPADNRASTPTPAPTAAPAGAQSVEQRLSTLQSLHDKKLITDEEYAAKKKKILDEL